jgi:hypothetical protein
VRKSWKEKGRSGRVKACVFSRLTASARWWLEISAGQPSTSGKIHLYTTPHKNVRLVWQQRSVKVEKRK